MGASDLEMSQLAVVVTTSVVRSAKATELYAQAGRFPERKLAKQLSQDAQEKSPRAGRSNTSGTSRQVRSEPCQIKTCTLYALLEGDQQCTRSPASAKAAGSTHIRSAGAETGRHGKTIVYRTTRTRPLQSPDSASLSRNEAGVTKQSAIEAHR